MPGETTLTTDHVAVPDMRRPGYAGLGGKYVASADRNIVGYLYEIVELGPLADNGAPECGAVYGSVCSDLHVVADLDDARLRKFLKLAVVRGEAKPSAPITAPE